jgi:hypothetical protein
VFEVESVLGALASLLDAPAFVVQVAEFGARKGVRVEQCQFRKPLAC